MINPFIGYCAGFLLALSVYSLGYSDLYPDLQPSLQWFLVFTIGISFLLGRYVAARIESRASGFEPIDRHAIIFAVIMATFAAEVIYSGGIPLLQSGGDVDVDYIGFGIPVVHVAFWCFCYFYSVYWLDLFLLGQGNAFLAFSLCATSTSLLMFSRGAFVIVAIAMVAVYIQRKGISRKLIMTFALLSAFALWGFGKLGDIRTHGVSGESVILTIGEANDKFRDSSLPTELFWPYLYTSSPLANLQLNISSQIPTGSAIIYFELEFVPDFISKRLVSQETKTASVPLLITDNLTVSTMYGWSYSLFGWAGIWLTFFYFVVVSLCCLKILRNSKYFVAANGILTSLAFLGIFDNMYVLSGGILQVMIAVFLKTLERNPVEVRA